METGLSAYVPPRNWTTFHGIAGLEEGAGKGGWNVTDCEGFQRSESKAVGRDQCAGWEGSEGGKGSKDGRLKLCVAVTEGHICVMYK